MSVLFVCTGNIFRSVAAEYALRSEFQGERAFTVSSAGTMDAPGATVRADVAHYLQSKGLDVSRHTRRTLSSTILGESDLVISMGDQHQTILREKFRTQSVLFTEACGAPAESILDVDDLFSLEERHSRAAQEHIFRVLDEIILLTPALAAKLRAGRVL